jgi:flagellar biosynthesis protein FlhG
MDKRKNITAIIGPKGGVGKSTISVNLAIALSQMGKKVVTVDLDLGASNLHAIFGMRGSPHTLNDFIQNKVKNLTDIILNTNIDNVGIICGGDAPGITNMPYQKKMKLIRHLSTIDCDFVLLDLAPGASYNVVDFSIIAQKTLLVTTAEVPSLLNVYSFIKSAVFRRLTFFFKHNKCFELLELLDKAKEPDTHPHLKTMEGFFREARQTNSTVTDSAKKILSSLKPLVVVNRVRTGKDARAGNVIQNLLKEYLSIESAVIMTIRDDDAVGNAIAKLSPIMIETPNSPFSQDIQEIASRLC